ncbi:basic leucine zipper 34-like [Chenopodium quinoa]|uniref:basic leucine zipper 34-like n=1 Tax=Chenopodium quinoa TaxID=63459 RepID=UPI000B78831D|nr:basic leucine zipper 34-like [Chenopodium quinoa]
MAQLPPKVPNIIPQNSSHQQPQQQWQEFKRPHNQPQQQQEQQEAGQNPPWVDEFMQFSAVKRGTHRRTVSESSVAFVEAGAVPFLNGPFRPPETLTGRSKTNNDEEFDKFDDDQFMSMFSNELGGSSSNPSSTSDHNSTNEDQKRGITRKGEQELGGRARVEDGEKAEEVESLRKFDKEEAQIGGNKKGGNVAAAAAGGGGNDNDTGVVDADQQPVVDPKRVKRILANRQSAQRSRVRKLQYISELERSVTTLQSEVSALSPRVAFLDHQRMILNVDNSTLKAKIAALAQDKIFKDAHQEAMKREIERLRQVYYQQNLNKTENIVPLPTSSSLLPTTTQPQPPDTTVHKNEQLTG